MKKDRICPVHSVCRDDCEGCAHHLAYEKLRIKNERIKDRLQRKEAQLQMYRGFDQSRLHELMAADVDKRCVVLPCKVGDTVYTANHHGRMVDGIVESIHQNYVAGAAGRWVVTVYYPEYNGTAESGLPADFCAMNSYYGVEDFGKAVFLSPKEAEATLGKERSNP